MAHLIILVDMPANALASGADSLSILRERLAGIDPCSKKCVAYTLFKVLAAKELEVIIHL